MFFYHGPILYIQCIRWSVFFKSAQVINFSSPQPLSPSISVRNVVNLGGFALTGKIEFLPYVKVLNANPLIVNDAVFLGWEMKLVFCPNHFKRENHAKLCPIQYSAIAMSYSRTLIIV